MSTKKKDEDKFLEIIPEVVFDIASSFIQDQIVEIYDDEPFAEEKAAERKAKEKEKKKTTKEFGEW